MRSLWAGPGRDVSSFAREDHWFVYGVSCRYCATAGETRVACTRGLFIAVRRRGWEIFDARPRGVTTWFLWDSFGMCRRVFFLLGVIVECLVISVVECRGKGIREKKSSFVSVTRSNFKEKPYLWLWQAAREEALEESKVFSFHIWVIFVLNHPILGSKNVCN